MSKNHGGRPAFPVGDIGMHGDYGMTLRQYYAAKAMQGFIARGDERAFRVIAEECLELADAMIASEG